MRAMSLILAIGVGGAALALAAATPPSALSQAKAGMWELSGVPGVKTPKNECVSDLLALARYEHRGKNCTSRVVSDSASSTVIDYTCGGAGFGRTKIDVITPRSLRVATQGISDNMPFNYVLQARRVGECGTTASRH